MHEFGAFDPEGPLDLRQRIAALPPGSIAKGMFFQPIVEQARTASGSAPGRDRYLPLKDYPFAEWLEVLVDCSCASFPRGTPRERLRRVGQLVYPRFAETTLGRVVLSAAGRNIGAALRLVPGIYTAIGRNGDISIGQVTEGRAVVELRGFWDFPDAYHLGVFEGGLAAFGKIGNVRVRRLGLSNADLELTWR